MKLPRFVLSLPGRKNARIVHNPLKIEALPNSRELVPVHRMSLEFVYSLSLLLALAVILGVPVAGHTTVKDSVRMELRMHQFHVQGACGAGIDAIWPNVLQDLLGSPSRTYGYGDYGRVATEGMYIPSGYGEAVTNPSVGISIPDGYIGHNPQLGGGAYSLSGTGPVDCSRVISSVTSRLSGSWGLLNAGPFRITEWYATFNIPDGAVIALFEWEQGDGLEIAFDASFESKQSRVIDASAPGNKRPVASYSWNFGDGSSGTGARPTHTYDEPGEYTVRLVVADEDGKESSREETVTVHAVHLTVEVLSATSKVKQGDTISVVARVTNSGTEAIFAVRAARLFTYVTRMPEGLDVEGGQTFYLDVKPAALEDDEDIYESRSRLDPGESFELTREYVVHRSSQYRNIRSDDPSFRPEDLYLDWTGVAPVEGETPEIDEVVVRQPCLEAEEPCATTQIEVWHIDLVVKTMLIGDTELVETNSVRSGLVVGPSPRVPVSNGRPTRFADHRFRVDGVNRCRSGCIDYEVIATDRETGDPLPGLRLELSHPAIAGPAVVTPGQGGGFLCDREQNNCKQTITLRTDANGRVEGYLAVPGVIESVATSVTARSVAGQPYPYNATVGSQEHDLTIEPNVAFEGSIPVDAHQARDLGSSAAIRVGFRRADLPNKLCNGLKAAYANALKSSLVMSRRGGPPKTLMTDICGYVDAAGLSSTLNLAQRAAQVPQMAWLFHSTQLPDLGLAESRFVKSPPFFEVSSQFVDELSTAIEGRLDAKGDMQAGAAPFTLHEVSYLWVDPAQGYPVKKSALYFHLWDHKVLIDKDYHAGLWLVEAHDRDVTPAATALSEEVPEASTSISILGSGPVGKQAVVTSFNDSPDSLIAWADSLFANALITLSRNDPERVETVRVISVTGNMVEGQTAELASPLLYSHPSGASLTFAGEAEENGPPEPIGLTPADSVAVAESIRLSWATFQPVMEVVVEVALDPDFDNLAITRTVSGPDLLKEYLEVPIGDGGFLVDVPYYWRALSRDRTGESVWSDTTRFVVSSQVVSIVEEDTEMEIPQFLELEQNYPNPFNPSTTIVYSVPHPADVTLSVYDLLGRRVALLVNETRQQGTYTVNWDASGVPSGVYVYRIKAAGQSLTNKMTLLK